MIVDPDSMALLNLGSSLRTRAADVTFALASRLMPSLGISRVTDLTRMDQLGLPVFASVRPRGQALCVHAGKGLLAAEARVGALMEAVEFAAAEPHRSSWQGRDLRVGDLVGSWGGAFQLIDLAPRFGLQVSNDRLLHCVHCDDVAGGAGAWLPAELVFLPYDDPHGEAVFGWASNGLASGNTLSEATLHGLLEVLERDALAMNLAHDQSCWVHQDDLPAPFDSLARSWANLGVELAVRYLPNDFGLPCFSAVLVQDSQDQTVDLAEGSGLHLEPGIALARAVCEAAQSRLSCIHGGRDDLTDFYDVVASQGRARNAHDTPAYRAAFDRTRTVRWHALPEMPVLGRSVGELLTDLLTRLSDRGFRQVFRHCFALPLGDLRVVKIIVPRCEEAELPLERAGRRLLDEARAHG